MDGQIVYQVRVDSSNVASDLEAAGSKINSGTSTLITIGQQAAQRIGSALTSFFGAQDSAMTQMLSSLTSGFTALSGSAGGAATALAPLTAGIRTLLALDLNKLLSFFSQVSSIELGTAAANSVAAGAVSVLSAAAAKKNSVTSSGGGKTTVARYRKGAEYIERDKLAFLHRGEAVLTAAENESFRAMGGLEGVAMAAAGRPAYAAQTAAVPAASSPQNQNVNVTVELDGYQMAKVMATATNDLNRQLNTRVIK